MASNVPGVLPAYDFNQLALYEQKAVLTYDPDIAWDILKNKSVVNEVIPIDPNTPKREGHLRFVCVSDTHGLTKKMKGHIPDGDVLLHGGDFSNTGEPQLITEFDNWLAALPHKYKVVIAGNHDLTFDPASYPETYKRFGHKKMFDTTEVKKSLKSCIYLEDSGVVIEGIKIYGSPWQPEFCNWAFNLKRGDPLRAVWKKIPTDTDILMTHGPPIGHGDLTTHGNRTGCVDLFMEIHKRIKPKYHIFGHIHEGYGVTTNGVTTFINASTCDFHYRPVQPPIVFDYPLKKN